MTASGFAGLGYQIVWTQQSALWLGHEAAAVLAVVTAFFGGLGVGAWALGNRIEGSRHPARWYAACEGLIALWSVALAFGLQPISNGMLWLIGDQPGAWWQASVSIFGTIIVLLPATAAMGATLPAMERLVSQAGRGGRHLAGLYASNTLGALFGVLATAFWLVPTFGLMRSAALCAGLNLVCALSVLALRSSPQPGAAAPPAVAPSAALLRLAATGLLGIGFEVVVVRVLSQVAEDTVYTFAILLAVYLLGSALGAAAYLRLPSRQGDAPALRHRWLTLQAIACLLGTVMLWSAEHLQQAVRNALGPGMATALAGEVVLALAAFALPTVVMGALFSHLATEARTAGHSLGRALAFNTVGAAAAPVLFGVLLVPALGPKLTLLSIAAGYLALGKTTGVRQPLFWIAAGTTLVLAVGAPPLAFVDVPPGGRVLSYRDGTMAAVSVVEDAQGVARLRINNRQQEGSSATLLADGRQALLPLLLHPSPQRALFLGLGTGTTALAAAEDPKLRVDAVELLPEVIAASVLFSAHLNPRLQVMAADARRYVKTTGQHYDVIVSDNFHPARSGSGTLYTVEHFQAVRGRLSAQGVFCQWLPLHQLDIATLRSIVRSFIAVYPNSWAMLATNSLETPVLGLVARRDASVFRLPELRAGLARGATSRRLEDFGLTDELALLGGFVAGPASLGRLAANAPLNTDDRPVVSYRAPRITYVPDSLPRDRLSALLQEVHIEPGELVASGSEAAWPRRLAAYWRARDRFIEVGRDVRPSADLPRMLAQVREPLLSVLRISADFRPAYDPLLRMALALRRSEATAAHALLADLAQVQPWRPEARMALRELNVGPP